MDYYCILVRTPVQVYCVCHFSICRLEFHKVNVNITTWFDFFFVLLFILSLLFTVHFRYIVMHSHSSSSYLKWNFQLLNSISSTWQVSTLRTIVSTISKCGNPHYFVFFVSTLFSGNLNRFNTFNSVTFRLSKMRAQCVLHTLLMIKKKIRKELERKRINIELWTFRSGDRLHFDIFSTSFFVFPSNLWMPRSPCYIPFSHATHHRPIK